MKKLLLISLLFIGCKKKDSPTPQSQLQTIAASIGFQFEHRYRIADSPVPNYASANDSGQIIFHNNNTITEHSSIYGDTTYSVVYISSTNNLTSVYQNGSVIKVYVPNGSYLNKAVFSRFSAEAQNIGDTMMISTFESGDAIYQGKPTLAIQGAKVTGNNAYFYLWLN